MRGTAADAVLRELAGFGRPAREWIRRDDPQSGVAVHCHAAPSVRRVLQIDLRRHRVS